MKTPRRWVDPFDDMSDDEFDAHVDKLFATRPATVAVSLRMAPDLLARMKREAGRAQVPYQTFMKGILEAGISRLERGRPRSVTTRSRHSPRRRAV
jgi:predicted DNA binding CopG/RHH family protein